MVFDGTAVVAKGIIGSAQTAEDTSLAIPVPDGLVEPQCGLPERESLSGMGFDEWLTGMDDVHVTEPPTYLDSVKLISDSALCITDFAGIQEETTILGIPCLTLLPNTERPITIEQGTNRLVGNKKQAIVEAFEAVMLEKKNDTRIPNLWDGNAAARIVDVIVSWSSKK